MKRHLVFIAACVMGCAGAGETSEDDIASAGDALAAQVEAVPGFAAAEITAKGLEAPLYGGLSLQVGPGDAEKYVITAYARDGSASLHGQIDLRGDLAPAPIGQRDVVTRFESAGDYASLGENRGAFNLVKDGRTTSFAVRSAVVRVDTLGRTVAELHGIASDRIDPKNKRILEGEDLVVEVRGRLIGTCLTELPTGATVMDPRNETPRCKELLSGL